MSIDSTERHNSNSNNPTPLSIIFIHDNSEEELLRFHSTLHSHLDASRYAVKLIPLTHLKNLAIQKEPSIFISYLDDFRHIESLITYTEKNEKLIHISITNGKHASLLSKAVSNNRLYKFIISPVTTTSMEAHIIEACQELSLRQKRRILLNEIINYSDQLDTLDHKLQSSLLHKSQRSSNNLQIDPLTNLPNRYLIFDRISHAVNLANRNSSIAAVLCIDVDRFGVINQSLGLRSGNQLLRNFAQRLVACARQTDSVAREGNDEFLLVLPEVENSASVLQLVKRIQRALSQPFLIYHQEIFITASIGICVYPTDADDPESLIRAANTAMNHARQLGGNNYQYFEREMNVRINKLVDMERNLFRALEKNEFLMYYQPQVDLRSGKIVGAEALLRWLRPGHGIISPTEFIPILEETGLIEGVGEWILHNVTTQSEEWLSVGLPRLRMNINLSLRQVKDDSILNTVAKLASKFSSSNRINPIELEITESIMMKDAAKVINLLGKLNEMGFNLAIDDFGTGYASLNYLTQFPVHSLKIDLSFVQRIETSTKDAAIVKAIILMAHSLGLRVTAEGVETRQQLAFLTECGCDEIQGYLFSKPLPANEFEALLRADKRLVP